MAWVPTSAEVRSELGADTLSRHLGAELRKASAAAQDVHIDAKIAAVEGIIRSAFQDGLLDLVDADLTVTQESQVKNFAIVLVARELNVAQEDDSAWKARIAAAEAFLERARRGQGGIGSDNSAGETAITPRVRMFKASSASA